MHFVHVWMCGGAAFEGFCVLMLTHEPIKEARSTQLCAQSECFVINCIVLCDIGVIPVCNNRKIVNLINGQKQI